MIKIHQECAVLIKSSEKYIASWIKDIKFHGLGDKHFNDIIQIETVT